MSEVTEHAPATNYVDALENASATLQAGIEQAQEGLKIALSAKQEVDQLILESRNALTNSPEAIESHLRAAVESYLQRLKTPSAPAAPTVAQAANADIQEADGEAPQATYKPDLEGLKNGIDDEVLGTRYRPVEDDEFEGVDRVTPETLEAEESEEEEGEQAAVSESAVESKPEPSTDTNVADDPAEEGSQEAGTDQEAQDAASGEPADDMPDTFTVSAEEDAEDKAPSGEKPELAPEQDTETQPDAAGEADQDATAESREEGDPEPKEEEGDSQAQQDDAAEMASPEAAPSNAEAAPSQEAEAPAEERKEQTDEEGAATSDDEDDRSEAEAEESLAAKLTAESNEENKEDADRPEKGFANSLKEDGGEDQPPKKRRSVLDLLNGR